MNEQQFNEETIARIWAKLREIDNRLFGLEQALEQMYDQIRYPHEMEDQ